MEYYKNKILNEVKDIMKNNTVVDISKIDSKMFVVVDEFIFFINNAVVPMGHILSKYEYHLIDKSIFHMTPNGYNYILIGDTFIEKNYQYVLDTVKNKSNKYIINAITHQNKQTLLEIFAPFIDEIKFDDFEITIEDNNITYSSEEISGEIISDKINYGELIIIGSYTNAYFLGKLLPRATIYTYTKVPLIDSITIIFEGEDYYYEEPIYDIPSNVKQIFPPKKYWPY